MQPCVILERIRHRLDDHLISQIIGDRMLVLLLSFFYLDIPRPADLVQFVQAAEREFVRGI